MIRTRNLLLGIFLLAMAACGGGPDRWRVQYGYGEDLPFPDSATAIDDATGKIVARARYVRLIKMPDDEPNRLEIEEEHYGEDGAVVYRGRVVMRFEEEGATPIEEKSLEGRKRWQPFPNWPDESLTRPLPPIFAR